jgi:hypothetical protein
VLSDRTAVDQEVEELRRQNFLRQLRVQTSRGDVGLALTQAYLARVSTDGSL